MKRTGKESRVLIGAAALAVFGISIAEYQGFANITGSTHPADGSSGVVQAALDNFDTTGWDGDDYVTVVNTDTHEWAKYWFDGNGEFRMGESSDTSGGSGSGGDPSGPGNTGNNPGNGHYGGNGNSGGAHGGTVTVRPLIPVRPT